MAKAYYSTVFEQPAQDIWKIIRDFNNYPVWVGGAGESRIENGKSGDTVGAVRNVLYQGRQIRQRLMAQSDVERSQTYEFYDAPTLQYLAKHELGGAVAVLPNVFERQDYGFALPDGSPLRESINRALLQELGSDRWRELIDTTGLKIN